MAQKDIYGDFYSPETVFSYDRLISILLGYRSIGKSTGVGIGLLKRVIPVEPIVLTSEEREKHQCEYGLPQRILYIRRRDKELQAAAPQAFSNARIIYNRYYEKDYNITYKKNAYYITGGRFGNDKVLLGYANFLDNEDGLKSIPYDFLKYGVYDEFLPRRGTKYLGSKDNPFVEWDCINSLCQTVDREIDNPYADRFRLFLIGNNLTYYNPIIMKLGADKYLETNTKYLAPKNMPYVIEQTQPGTIKATQREEMSNVEKLARLDDKSYKYAFGTGNDDDKFIGKPSGKVDPMCNVIYRGTRLGVGIDRNGIMFVSSHGNNSHVDLALTSADHGYNTLLAMQTNATPEMKFLRIAFNQGNVLFENGRCKYLLYQFFMFDEL